VCNDNAVVGNSCTKNLFPNFPVISLKLTEYLENTLDVLSMLSLQHDRISPIMWSFVPLLHNAFLNYATDSARNILIPLDNYISRSSDVFATSQDPDYAAMVFSMCEKVHNLCFICLHFPMHEISCYFTLQGFSLASSEGCQEAQQMAKLLESMFQNTRAYAEHLNR
jgi:hypothetical protein